MLLNDFWQNWKRWNGMIVKRITFSTLLLAKVGSEHLGHFQQLSGHDGLVLVQEPVLCLQG